MFIQTQDTPNPATIKFLPGQDVYPGKTADFQSAEMAGRSPLALRLFKLQGVSGIFLGHDFVSVSKAEDTDWSMLKPMVLSSLMEHFSMNMPIIEEGDSSDQGHNANEQDDDPLVIQIKELLDTRVRPMVAMDGGDITFNRFEDGIVFLEMRGACAGCPSSTATLKAGIENMLKHFVPEVEEVRPVSDSPY